VGGKKRPNANHSPHHSRSRPVNLFFRSPTLHNQFSVCFSFSRALTNGKRIPPLKRCLVANLGGQGPAPGTPGCHHFRSAVLLWGGEQISPTPFPGFLENSCHTERQLPGTKRNPKHIKFADWHGPGGHPPPPPARSTRLATPIETGINTFCFRGGLAFYLTLVLPNLFQARRRKWTGQPRAIAILPKQSALNPSIQDDWKIKTRRLYINWFPMNEIPRTQNPIESRHTTCHKPGSPRPIMGLPLSRWWPNAFQITTHLCYFDSAVSVSPTTFFVRFKPNKKSLKNCGRFVRLFSPTIWGPQTLCVFLLAGSLGGPFPSVQHSL